jgi:hypothetical protein
MSRLALSDPRRNTLEKRLGYIGLTHSAFCIFGGFQKIFFFLIENLKFSTHICICICIFVEQKDGEDLALKVQTAKYMKKLQTALEPNAPVFILPVLIDDGILFLLFTRGTGPDTVKLAVVNSSTRKMNHPRRATSRKQKFLANIEIDNIPKDRASNEAWWMFLTCNSSINVDILYGVMLPWLVEKPVQDAITSPRNWK